MWAWVELRWLTVGGYGSKVGRCGEQGSGFPASHGRHNDTGMDHTVFVGTHERTLDEKGRMALPVSFRSQLGERGYLVDLDGCLGIYAEDGFRETVDRLNDRVRRGDASQDSLRVFSASVHDLKVDSQGRVVLPASHRAKADIDSDVVVIGAINRIEVWQPDGWTEIQQHADGDDRRAGSWL